ncbi:acyl carrier protein 1, mitochondrial-like [Musa acuminata AAA Group]|uniref:acyl carrier protein 1, mitochondrial-like n=1 Tax=Musa acuminata AAA Group TaxID=214697 RepID=UPI0031D3D9E8
MASALRGAILGHVRVPIRTLDRLRSLSCLQTSIRSMSSHGDDHLTREEVVDRVLDVVKSFPKVDPAKVTPDVHFQTDLGLDSLDNVEIVMALEEEFKLEIPDKEADQIVSCPLAVEYIAAHPMAS